MASLARTVTTVLLAAVLAGGVTACGGGGTGGGGDHAATPGGPFPVSVPGRFGTTTVPERPVRVVAMDSADADFALSLGVVPVGIGRGNNAPTDIQPWTAPALGGRTPAAFDARQGDPLEAIAALRPDLILATKDFNLDQSHEMLSRIAPVVSYQRGPNDDPWQQSLDSVARALGVAEQGRRVVADTQAWIGQQKAARPELTGRTFTYLVAPGASGIVAVNSPDDVSVRVLVELGMRMSPSVLPLPTAGVPGRAPVSEENMRLVDADVILAAGSPAGLAGLARNPVFQGLRAVRGNAYLTVDYTLASALVYPTPLSLRWALPQLLPQLSAAVTP
ncbi:MAG TPA: ABC transporter substrate-binding protein [Pseudonocardia sp.]|jgi:iron complex transport system substrate-binding protein